MGIQRRFCAGFYCLGMEVLKVVTTSSNGGRGNLDSLMSIAQAGTP